MIERSSRMATTKEARIAWLGEQLAKLPAEQIVDFQMWLEVAERRSSTWDMFGTFFHVFNSGSQDAFKGFQYWLIGLGKEAFELVAENPDRLIEVPRVQFLRRLLTQRFAGGRKVGWTEGESPNFEELAYVAYDAYRKVADFASMSQSDGITAFNARVWEREELSSYAAGIAGDEWDIEDQDEVSRRLPLTTRYLESFQC